MHTLTYVQCLESYGPWSQFFLRCAASMMSCGLLQTCRKICIIFYLYLGFNLSPFVSVEKNYNSVDIFVRIKNGFFFISKNKKWI